MQWRSAASLWSWGKQWSAPRSAAQYNSLTQGYVRPKVDGTPVPKFNSTKVRNCHGHTLSLGQVSITLSSKHMKVANRR